MSLQSEYLMTSELQFGFKEHSSTILCSTLLVGTVEYYLSNYSSVYVLLIDASKAHNGVKQGGGCFLRFYFPCILIVC